jgi:nucleoside 2-deoxyribosyltransferase
MKIYLANSLTYASQEFKNSMIGLRQELKKNFEVLEYFGLESGDDTEVYKHDIACVKDCDLVLAEVSYPSTGLGIEIATALHLGKKVLAVAQQNVKVSRMVTGLPDNNFKFERYSTIKDIINLLEQ